MKRLILGLCLAAIPMMAWAEPVFKTDRQAYGYGMTIKYSVEGLPPNTLIFFYSALQSDGSSEPSPDQMSMGQTIQTGPMGIVEGELTAPLSGNTPTFGHFIVEARPNNDRAQLGHVKVRLVPLSITPEFVGYEDTNGSMALSVSGFVGFSNLYCHYIYQKPGSPNRELKTVKVGALDATGSLKTKFKKFPFAPPKGGYLIQFDGNEKYVPTDGPSTPSAPYILFSTSVV